MTHKLAAAARKVWQPGDRVRIWNSQEHDGQTGTIYCVPPARHPNWLYTVTLDHPGEHTCVCCACEEMESLDPERERQLVEIGVCRGRPDAIVSLSDKSDTI